MLKSRGSTIRGPQRLGAPSAPEKDVTMTKDGLFIITLHTQHCPALGAMYVAHKFTAAILRENRVWSDLTGALGEQRDHMSSGRELTSGAAACYPRRSEIGV